jgi:hypothetical protein
MLPDLPKKNKKKEAEFGLVFRKWIEENPPIASYPYELKDTDGEEYLNFAEVTPDQVNSALRSKSVTGNLIRIVNGTPGAPDYVFYCMCKYAWVVIRYPKGFVLIDIDAWLKEKKTSNRKSLIFERAIKIATFSVCS